MQFQAIEGMTNFRKPVTELGCIYILQIHSMRCSYCYRSFVASRLLSELDNLYQGNVRGRSLKVHNRSTQFIQHTCIQDFSLIY
jgi:hypothetical protein